MHPLQTATSSAQKIARYAACLLSALASPAAAQGRQGLRDPDQSGQVPLSAKTAHYRLRAKYDVSSHQIQGQLSLRWTNLHSRPARHFALRTYLNAQAHTQSAWMQDLPPYLRKSVDLAALGYLQLQELHIDDAASGPNQWRDSLAKDLDTLNFRPDPQDPTTLWIDLPQPIRQGQSIDLNLGFVTQLPRVFSRTGYSEDFVLASQWFPKAAAYDDQGWHTQPFRYHSEFASDFADYEVWLDLPQDLVVVGTGELVSETVIPGSTPARHWHHRRAQMVHDFAWSAMLDGELMSAQQQDVEIQGLVAPNSPIQEGNHLALLSELLSVMQRRYGPYPWRHISYVVVPEHAEGAAGMEYPTFFTTQSYEPGQLPSWLYLNRYHGIWTTIHEFGHQYFQGMVANDEHQAPWMDEGLNTLTDVLAFDDVFGQDAALMSYAGYPISAVNLLREVLYAPFAVPVNQPASAFSSYPDNYGSTVYARCALAWLTLRNLCGHQSFDRALASYVEGFRFAHPSPAQVQAHFAKILGPSCEVGSSTIDVSSYLDLTLNSAFVLDFGVRVYAKRRPLPKAGWRFDPQNPGAAPAPVKDSPSSDTEQIVVISRRGNLRLPLEYEIHWEDGSTSVAWWSGDTDTLRLRFQDKGIKMVVLDPKRKLALESSRLNNIGLAPYEQLSPSQSRVAKAPISMARALVYALGSAL